ncbi:hypothetical protein SDC9_128685 [bioreactor metagenome]|uniref:HD domain-containing protein n=1 Tax=bioreactor metagenome TaxID=1076179 RepID=A0A645CXJ8_9ZZZZ
MVSACISRMIEYFGKDHKRINHALKVHGFAEAIAGAEGLTGVKAEILLLSAVLHDIGIREAESKYHSSAGSYQEIEGPPVAKNILQDCGATPEMIDRVCYLVGNHHSYHRIDGLDFQILVEADFLVNIYEEGLDREAVFCVREKYFKTNRGLSIVDSMYLSQDRTQSE